MLEPLLADDTVTEIMVNGADEVYVERDGASNAPTSRSPTRRPISDDRPDRLAVLRRVDESSPMVDARLPTGERVNVIIRRWRSRADGDDPLVLACSRWTELVG